MDKMDEYIKLKCGDDYNIYLPRPIAETSVYIKDEIKTILKSKTDLELSQQMLEIDLSDIKGNIMEIIVDYMNHKYYYENMKDVEEVINEQYYLKPESSLDVLIACVKLKF